VIRLLGPTLRFEVLGCITRRKCTLRKKQCIWAFWHRVIIPMRVVGTAITASS